MRRPSKRLVESVCAAARVGMNSGSHKVGLTSRERSQLIDQYGQSKGEGIIDLFVGHLHTIKSKELKEVYIPKGIKKALSCEDKDLWQEALDSEYNSLMSNKTWHLDHLPHGSLAIPCQWIFNVKFHSDGTVDRYKARLVALGNRQEYGVDFDEVYSPVARFESLRLVLAIGCITDAHIIQMDVCTAFLNGLMPEGIKVYMRQPQGYAVKGQEHLVCALDKSIYGLKQAPRIWYLLMNEFLSSLGFERCKHEYCLYVKRVGDDPDEWIIVVVYVDDLTIMSKNMDMINTLKEELSKRFQMKDLGDINYILKIEVTRNRESKTLQMSQRKYIKDLLKKYNMEECSEANSPQSDIVLQPEKIMNPAEIAAQPYDYRGLIGSLQYLVRGTRPDIANAVRDLSRFLACYNETHWKEARRVLKYLKKTSNYGLFMDGNDQTIEYEVYTDASFACREKERKSVSGYCVKMASTCISWSSSKQDSVALSTTESEIIALSEGLKESEWLYHILKELGFVHKLPIQVWCDSIGAIKTCTNPGNHKSTKHIETRHLFGRDLTEKGRVIISYLNTTEMLADCLTKALSGKQFEKLRYGMGIRELL